MQNFWGPPLATFTLLQIQQSTEITDDKKEMKLRSEVQMYFIKHHAVCAAELNINRAHNTRKSTSGGCVCTHACACACMCAWEVCRLIEMCIHGTKIQSQKNIYDHQKP